MEYAIISIFLRFDRGTVLPLSRGECSTEAINISPENRDLQRRKFFILSMPAKGTENMFTILEENIFILILRN